MPLNQLVKTLLQKESLEQCSLQELEQFAERHPYFGAAQLLLTKKLQTEKPERYDEQLQKTFLFFHNPLWVEHLLNETGEAAITRAEKKQNTAQAQAIIAEQEKIPEIETMAAGTGTAEPPLTPVENDDLLPLQNETTSDIKKEEVVDHVIAATELTESNTVAEEPAFTIPGLKMEAIDPAKAEFIFEPFHTVDYFASQGIKFKEEEKPVDKFSQQLKSFTDWLKTMKKLPVSATVVAGETSTGLPPGAEEKVEQMAEKSISEREIVTETMAEVWEKQGNMVKATEVYNKLSLLYPSKSPYFAAKIEDLKKIN